MELWKSIDFGTIYEVSNQGRVRSIDFYDSWNRLRKGRILKHTLDKGGYSRVRLSFNSMKCSFRVHRLVAKYFIPNPENKPQVNHIDGNKTNNNYLNLEYSTNSENQLHAIKTGLKITKVGKDSVRFKGSILVFDKSGKQIDELFGNIDMKNKGYDYRNISAVILGKRKTYKNLIFKRKN